MQGALRAAMLLEVCRRHLGNITELLLHHLSACCITGHLAHHRAPAASLRTSCSTAHELHF